MKNQTVQKAVLSGDIPVGLTSSEAAALVAEGKCNKADLKSGKSYLRIAFDNIFTFFNMIWVVVSAVLIAVGSYTNLTFLAIVIPNTLIAMVQEMRAKHTVEKLSVTTDPVATVVRDGAHIEIPASDIVLGDVMYAELGRQILSDGVVISGAAEANESMLTGESNAIKKAEGDRVLAGSYLVSGAVYIKVTSVGADNYVHKIEKNAKSFKAPASNLFRDLNVLIKNIGVFMIPMAVLLFLSNYYSAALTATEVGAALVSAVNKTCGSIVGMIPSGIFLLVTLTLSLSVITLGKKGSLVRDMYSIEMLASADVICLDKTGTITDGTMMVTAVETLSDTDEREVGKIVAMVEGAERSINNTTYALIEKFGSDRECEISDRVPFSSERKYSSVKIVGVGCYSIGAPHFVKCPVSEELEEKINAHAALGERVILLVKQPDIECEGEAIALIAISDRIRPNAKETIEKFQEQGVTVKVISGDHAKTVSSIAARVGIHNADRYLSCEGMSDEELAAVAEDYTVFGRVTPEQKILLVKTLRSAGHTVAMTGDGVNDTLALKESDCSIAMADGSEVARKVAKIVLMQSDFGVLPDVVKEGRRCINNVRMTSVLYLMKTIFTVILSVFTLMTLSGYPFDPKQMVFVEMFIIGMSSLMLTLEPNFGISKGSYIDTVIRKSMPNAIVMLIPVFLVQVIGKGSTYTSESVSAIATLAVTLGAYMNLIFLCKPYSKWRIWVVSICGVLLGISIPVSMFFLDDMMNLLPAFDNLGLLFYGMGLAIGLALLIHVGIKRIKIQDMRR